MRPPSTDLDAWIIFARQRRLNAWLAFVLEALDPLAPLAAQALYLIEPVFGLRSETRSLARALEDDESRQDLRRRLMADRSA